MYAKYVYLQMKGAIIAINQLHNLHIKSINIYTYEEMYV